MYLPLSDCLNTYIFSFFCIHVQKDCLFRQSDKLHYQEKQKHILNMKTNVYVYCLLFHEVGTELFV